MKYAFVLAIALAVLCPMRAQATQQFAKETMLSCSACHTAAMQLTSFGRGFRNSNLRMVRLTATGAPAAALRGQFAYSSEPDPTGLPKAIVDEVDDFLAGQAADNWTYFADIYNVDGGTPGAAREAWVEYTSDHRRGPQSLRVIAGLIALPTPVDPESFRELNQHYAVWDQTVGSNTFNFFDPHNAIMLSRGSEIRGTSISIAAVQGHDKQSQIPSDGIDAMVALKHIMGPVVLDAYRYDGKRPTGLLPDSFSRTGFGAEFYAGRFQALAVTQSGYDSSALGDGIGIASGGGFLQTRYQLSSALFAIARYEGIEDATGTFSRAFTFGAGTRIGNNFRLEAEDVVQHVPQTKNQLGIVFGWGFANVGGSQSY